MYDAIPSRYQTLSSAQAQRSLVGEFNVIRQNSFSHSLARLENFRQEPNLVLEICKSMAHILLNTGGGDRSLGSDGLRDMFLLFILGETKLEKKFDFTNKRVFKNIF